MRDSFKEKQASQFAGTESMEDGGHNDRYIQRMEEFIGHFQDSGFHSESNGKPLKGSVQSSGLI